MTETNSGVQRLLTSCRELFDRLKMADWQRIARLTLMVVMSTIYTCMSILRFAYEMITKGTNVMLKRVVHPPAAVLTDKEWNHDYVKLSTLKLHYVHTGARNKPLMLFLHGFPEFWYSWRHQLREFSKDYWCVAIDMRGYNLSDKPKGIGAYRTTALAQDVREVIEAFGRTSCVLVAHDWGGAVAWLTTLMYPEFIDKLIIMNCPHPVAFRTQLQSSWSQFMKSWYMFLFQCPYWPEFLLSSEDCHSIDVFFRLPDWGVNAHKANTFTDKDIAAWKHVYTQPGVAVQHFGNSVLFAGAWTAPLNYYRAAMQLAPDTSIPRNKIKPATLIIWGTGDGAIDTVAGENSVKYCDNAQIRRVEGASHWVQQESPKECNAFMWEFLRK